MARIGKKQVMVFALIIIIFALIAAGYFVYQKYFSEKEEVKKEKTVAEKQLEELDAIREQRGDATTTEEEAVAQIKELDTARKEAGVQKLSQEDIQKQLELLDKLRQQQQ